MTPDDRCGYTVTDEDGIEQPCDRPTTGWRWYQDVEHEDLLEVACELHENEGGRRMHAAEAKLARIDHAAEAARLADGLRILQGQNADFDMELAQVHATLALVEQQRIANLVAIAHATDGALSTVARDLAYLALGAGGLNPDIAAALGIGGDQ